MQARSFKAQASYWAVSALALLSALFTTSLNACATAAAKVTSIGAKEPLLIDQLVERYRLHDGS